MKLEDFLEPLALVGICISATIALFPLIVPLPF